MSSTLSEGVRVPDIGSVNWGADVNFNWGLLNTALANISSNVKVNVANTWTATQTFSETISGSIDGVAARAVNDEDGNNIKTALAGKAADNAVVHLAGAETISGDKTWTGSNAFSAGVLTGLVETNPGNTGLLLRSTDQTWENGARIFLYSNTHTGQTNGSIYIDVDHGDGNNTKTGLLLVPYALYPAGGGTNGVSLGTSADQWASVYARTYYYNGTQWGLDTSNEWTGHNKFVSPNTNFGFKSTTAEAGSSTASSNWIYWQDKNDYQDAYISRDIWGDGSDSLRIAITSKRSNGAPSTTGTAVDCGLSLNIHANGSTSITPFDNGGTDLGTSSNKWKTLNGINPGALSLPDTYLNLDTTDWNLTGTSFNYVPSIDGWLFINVRPSNNYAYVAIEAAHMRNNSENTAGRNAMACIAVRKNVSATITLVGASIAQARLVSCAGNV